MLGFREAQRHHSRGGKKQSRKCVYGAGDQKRETYVFNVATTERRTQRVVTLPCQITVLEPTEHKGNSVFQVQFPGRF